MRLRVPGARITSEKQFYHKPALMSDKSSIPLVAGFMKRFLFSRTKLYAETGNFPGCPHASQISYRL
jgi:hypothetical protein